MYCQDNIEELFELIGQLPGQKFLRTKKYDFIKTNNSIWPNLLFNFKATLNNIEETLNEIENNFHYLKLPNLLMCKPISNNTDIINYIKSRNYISNQWTAMTHYLSFEKNSLPISKRSLNIKLIHNKTDLKLWMDIVELELMGKMKLNFNIFQNLLKDKNCFFFLGFNGNIPIATSLFFKGKTSGGLYLVSTIKAHRNKGIGKKMTFICLKKAKELKCEKVDLQSTYLGKKVYESLGFKNYGDINVFRIKNQNL